MYPPPHMTSVAEHVQVLVLGGCLLLLKLCKLGLTLHTTDD
jgi:hypothetical protein